MNRTYRYLSEFTVGEKFTTLAQTVTETDVILFAGITGDKNPIHTDRTYAEKLPFGSRLAHGMLGASVAIGLWGRMGMVDGSAIAALSTEWKFVGPIKIGDTIHAVIEVLEAKKASKGDRGVLNIGYTIINQDGAVCQTGSMATMLKWSAPEGE